MDTYPYLSHWLHEEAQGAQALLGMVFLTGLVLIGYVLVIRRWPTLTHLHQWAFSLFCLLSILFMLAFR